MIRVSCHPSFFKSLMISRLLIVCNYTHAQALASLELRYFGIRLWSCFCICLHTKDDSLDHSSTRVPKSPSKRGLAGVGKKLNKRLHKVVETCKPPAHFAMKSRPTADRHQPFLIKAYPVGKCPDRQSIFPMSNCRRLPFRCLR